MALNSNCHCLPVAFPQRGTGLEVGEEKGDGAARQAGQDVRPAPLSRHAMAEARARKVRRGSIRHRSRA